jgi:hypothetical protein
MSIFTSLLTAGTNSHQETSENANAVATDFVSPGVIGTISSTSGVAPTTGAWAVNAQGSPNMTVAVSTGILYVAATPTSQNSQTLRVRNAASTNVTISANASGSTKYDFLYVSIDATKAANPAVDASDVATLVTSRSSSNSTDNGTPPTYGYLLAVITVSNGAVSITNGNITDKRTQAAVTPVSDGGITLSTIRSENSFDYIASGCVLSGTGYGSTLAWNLTAGVVYIGGRRLTVAASSGTVTASKDTYFDLLDPGSGTVATLVFSGGNVVANNAASPALAASSVRLGIIVSGANIAAATSVNQGQEDRVLPIASSVAYSVTDSLGNLICPRDPNRKILGYRQITTSYTTTSGSYVDIPGLSLVANIPANRKIKVKTYSGSPTNTGGAPNGVALNTYDVTDGTQIAQSAMFLSTPGQTNTVIAEREYTPSVSGARTFKSQIAITNGGTASTGSGPTYPTFLVVELA